MGLFSRTKSTQPESPAMAELGREFAIARRHGDRKTMRRIGREYADAARSDSDAASFQHGQGVYDAMPPIKPERRNRRR
ncbi:hypothetical protein OG292_19555 [Streptomyces sp. NBC_01511]|uniref:hypothetical protein n=1 Tax=Streptomyces sp. NBC_01511 TaxID=2903889 RepID=UPI00386A5B0A